MVGDWLAAMLQRAKACQQWRQLAAHPVKSPHGTHRIPRRPVSLFLLLPRGATHPCACLASGRRGEVLADANRLSGNLERTGFTPAARGARAYRNPPDGDHPCLEPPFRHLRSRTSRSTVSGCCATMKSCSCRSSSSPGFVRRPSSRSPTSRLQARITSTGPNSTSTWPSNRSAIQRPSRWSATVEAQPSRQPPIRPSAGFSFSSGRNLAPSTRLHPRAQHDPTLLHRQLQVPGGLRLAHRHGAVHLHRGLERFGQQIIVTSHSPMTLNYQGLMM